MNNLAVVIGKFPEHEFALRRLYACDPDFRELCEDHATASCALERWKQDDVRSEDYRRLIRELENLIVNSIETHQRNSGAAGSK